MKRSSHICQDNPPNDLVRPLQLHAGSGPTAARLTGSELLCPELEESCDRGMTPGRGSENANPFSINRVRLSKCPETGEHCFEEGSLRGGCALIAGHCRTALLSRQGAGIVPRRLGWCAGQCRRLGTGNISECRVCCQRRCAQQVAADVGGAGRGFLQAFPEEPKETRACGSGLVAVCHLIREWRAEPTNTGN